MFDSLKKDLKELIKIGDYVEVSGIVAHPEEGRQFAFQEGLWFFQLKTRDSWRVWNGNGIDPRERK